MNTSRLVSVTKADVCEGHIDIVKEGVAASVKDVHPHIDRAPKHGRSRARGGADENGESSFGRANVISANGIQRDIIGQSVI